MVLASCAQALRSRTAAVPQRPLFTVDIHTVDEGSVQSEMGLALEVNGRFDTPVLGTYGLSEKTQVMLGTSPWVYVSRPGSDGSGPGDVSFGFKHRLRDPAGEIPGFALQFVTKLPTATRQTGVGTGELDFLARGVMTKTIDAWSLTVNYELGILGDAQGEGADLGHSLSCFAAHPLGQRLTGFGEVLAELRPEEDYEAALLGAGLAWRPRASTVVDAGLSIGLAGDGPDFRLFVGMAINFGTPLFGAR